MSQKVTFKPDGPESQWPGDNVKTKDWAIKIGDEVVGSIESHIRDLFMSRTQPGYSVTVTAVLHGVEKQYRENSAAFSNRNLREARDNRSTYLERAKQWVIKQLAERDALANQENTRAD
jgi:hypothetical protein